MSGINPWAVLAAGAAAFVGPAARADVVEATASSMQVKITLPVAAPPERVYAGLVAVGAWWSSDHTFSGDSRNLHLDARPGGCWCETLPNGGGVQHMSVVFVAPGKRIVLHGALGPLQASGVAGAMTWQLAPKDGGTELVLVYNVGGYAPGGLSALAPAVDGVLREQLGRLKRLVETGNPAAAAAGR